MSLKIKDMNKIIEEHIPSELKESYDNVGLMVGDNESEVTAILIALDCTLDVIREAVDRNCNTIVTHHPLLFRKPSSITTDTLTGKKIIELIKNNINVYSIHTNLDSVKGGINDMVMTLLDFKNYETMEVSKNRCCAHESSGIGRIATLEDSITLDEMCDRVKESLNAPILRYSGDESKKIEKVAVVNGSGQDYFDLAKKKGVDCIITGDTTYHYASDCEEEGLCIIDAGHFETEWPAMEIWSKWLKNIIQFKGFNNAVLISESTRNPYKYK